MAKLTPYDPAAVVVLVGGIPLSGFGNGTFVQAGFDEDQWTSSVGADGEVIRVRNNNRMGTITFTLQQSSTANVSLTALGLLDSEFGSGVVPIIIKDTSPSSTTLVFGEKCWIKKPADRSYGKEASEREWVFAVATLVMGG